jgi:hypothetical protein
MRNQANMFKSCFKLIVFIFIILFLNSCKQKGCNDKSALNYSIAAKENDGSCIYCSTTISQNGTNTIYLTDPNTLSAHYNDTVAIFYLTQSTFYHNYHECGIDSTYLYLRIRNIINQGENFFFNFNANSLCDFVRTSMTYVTIPPNQITDEILFDTKKYSGCSITGSSPSIFISGRINYQ